MLKNTNVMKEGSRKPVSLVGKTEDRMMVTINTVFTTIRYVQPVVIFFYAARHKGQT